MDLYTSSKMLAGQIKALKKSLLTDWYLCPKINSRNYAQSINQSTNKYISYLTTKRQHEIKFYSINFDNVPSVEHDFSLHVKKGLHS